MNLAVYQYARDMNKLTKKYKVHKDLLEYHRLKTRWSLGFIKIKLTNCDEKYCRGRPKRMLHKNMRKKHSIVLGYSVNEDNTVVRCFLGYTLKHAHERLEYVKRGLFV